MTLTRFQLPQKNKPAASHWRSGGLGEAGVVLRLERVQTEGIGFLRWRCVWQLGGLVALALLGRKMDDLGLWL